MANWPAPLMTPWGSAAHRPAGTALEFRGETPVALDQEARPNWAVAGNKQTPKIEWLATLNGTEKTL